MNAGFSAAMMRTAPLDEREERKVRNPRPLGDAAEPAKDKVFDVYTHSVVVWRVEAL